MSFKSGRDRNSRVKKGRMAGLTGKKMGGKVGYENPNVDTLTVAINRYTRTAG